MYRIATRVHFFRVQKKSNNDFIMNITCRECGLIKTNNDGYEWTRERKNDFCCDEHRDVYEKRRETEHEYQLALSFSAPVNPEKTIPFKRTFRPLEKVPDPVAQEAFATLRQTDEVEKAPPIPLHEYFSLVKRGIPIPPVTTS